MNINDPANIDEAIEAIKEICPDAEETLTRKAETIVLCAVKDGELIKRHDTQWIPVTERLPEIGVDVLVVKDNGDKSLAVWRLYRTIPNGKPYWEDEVGDGLLLRAATHWMPLPEPPKGE